MVATARCAVSGRYAHEQAPIEIRNPKILTRNTLPYR